MLFTDDTDADIISRKSEVSPYALRNVAPFTLMLAMPALSISTCARSKLSTMSSMFSMFTPSGVITSIASRMPSALASIVSACCRNPASPFSNASANSFLASTCSPSATINPARRLATFRTRWYRLAEYIVDQAIAGVNPNSAVPSPSLASPALLPSSLSPSGRCLPRLVSFMVSSLACSFNKSSIVKLLFSRCRIASPKCSNFNSSTCNSPVSVRFVFSLIGVPSLVRA